MAGIDASEGAAAAAPPPEMTPAQRIQQVRRVPAWSGYPTSWRARSSHARRPRAAVVACRPLGFRLVIGWEYAFFVFR